jgi:hypothetical protein
MKQKAKPDPVPRCKSAEIHCIFPGNRETLTETGSPMTASTAIFLSVQRLRMAPNLRAANPGLVTGANCKPIANLEFS